MAVIGSAGTYLISTVGGLVLFVLVIRLFMQLAKIESIHPTVDNMIKGLDPFIKTVQGYLPSSSVELALVVMLMLVELIKLTCLYLISFGSAPSVLSLLIMTLAEGSQMLLSFCLYAVIADAVISWIPSLQGGPITSMLKVITNPILSPIRQYVTKDVKIGFDLSPIVAILLLQLIDMALVSPLIGYAFDFLN